MTDDDRTQQALEPFIELPADFDNQVLLHCELYWEGQATKPAQCHPRVWEAAVAKAHAFNGARGLGRAKAKLKAKDQGVEVSTEELFAPLVELAVEVYADAMVSPKMSDRLAAADTVLIRALGKPKETHTHEFNFKVELQKQVKELELKGISSSIPKRKTVLDNPDDPQHTFYKDYPPELSIIGRKASSGDEG